MRSMPLVLVILWFFFLVPYIGAVDHRRARSRSRSARSARRVITFTLFEAAYYCEIMRAGIQSIPRGQVCGRLRARPDLLADHGLHRAAAGVPQHAAGAAHADDHPVPGHVAGLRARRSPTSSAPRRRSRKRDGRLVEMYLFAAVVYFVICFALSYARASGCRSRIAIIR